MFKTFFDNFFCIQKVVLILQIILFGVKSVQIFHHIFVNITQVVIFLFWNYIFLLYGGKEMFVKNAENHIEVSDTGEINLGITLDCGQAFRWKENADKSWTGVVRGIETTVTKTENGLLFQGITAQQFTDVFYDYFDFGKDYAKILSQLSQDESLKKAIDAYGTIRILNQEPWEALCSFIISACNNIPRIKGIIERLCESFGERTGNSFSFPSPEKIASLEVSDLDIIRAGYRSPYIISAARMICNNEIDLDSLKNKSVDICEKELMKITGVGKKVADCTILFGLGHIDAFPVDRHIKRICEDLYPEGLPDCINGYGGIAQQYMFHMQRMKNT